MTITTTPPHPTVAQFVTEAIKTSGKLQHQIADECGWGQPNIVTMIKQGHTRLPLDKVGPLARSLDVDPVRLLRMAMREYMPETLQAVDDALQAEFCTEYERKLLTTYRDQFLGIEPEVVICRLEYAVPVRRSTQPGVSK